MKRLHFPHSSTWGWLLVKRNREHPNSSHFYFGLGGKGGKSEPKEIPGLSQHKGGTYKDPGGQGCTKETKLSKGGGERGGTRLPGKNTKKVGMPNDAKNGVVSKKGTKLERMQNEPCWSVMANRERAAE